MLFFESFSGQYISQVVFYSLVSAIIVGSFIVMWGIREPLLQIKFRFLILLLPLLHPLLFALVYPARNSDYFRQQVALVDLNGWLTLGLGKQIAVWHLFLAILAVSTGVFLAIEAVPAIKHYLGKSLSFPVIGRGRFSRLDEALANISVKNTAAAPKLLLSPEEAPTAYCMSGKRLAISASMLDLLDSDELQAVIEHELAHISRQLIWINRVTLTLRFLMFYNPIAFFVFYLINTDTEKLCDDIAIRSSGKKLSLISGLLKIFRYPSTTSPDEGSDELQSEPRVAVLRKTAGQNIIRERAERIMHGDDTNNIPYKNYRLGLTVALLTIVLFFVV